MDGAGRLTGCQPTSIALSTQPPTILAWCASAGAEPIARPRTEVAVRWLSAVRSKWR